MIPAMVLPAEELLIAYYIKGFPTTIAMWVKCDHKTTLQHAFVEACLVEKDMYGLKDNPNHEPEIPSTSRRRKEHVPKPTTLDKDPYEMGNMKKFLQRNSNDMVDIKRENGDNQGNNRGQVRKPPKIPYQPPLKPPETLTSNAIYSIFKSLTSTPQNPQNDGRQEIA